MNPAPRQHTPGPWRTEPAPHRSHWILGATSVALTTEPNEANARLIASAPELLAALEAAVGKFDSTVRALARGKTVSLSSLQNCAASARSAIARATGGNAS